MAANAIKIYGQIIAIARKVINTLIDIKTASPIYTNKTSSIWDVSFAKRFSILPVGFLSKKILAVKVIPDKARLWRFFPLSIRG